VVEEVVVVMGHDAIVPAAWKVGLSSVGTGALRASGSARDGRAPGPVAELHGRGGAVSAPFRPVGAACAGACGDGFRR
jgi:hypothetical protein